MFNRLKGAIDYVDQRFQEEQARARAAQNQPARSTSAARKPDPKSSTRPSRSASIDRRAKDGATKNPDPNEFDPEFVIGDESEQSRSGTPGASKTQEESGEASKQQAVESSDPKSEELPQDVRVKLRKLERLEYKYQELLRSYRIAHARVGTIEPFEAALRENTPLTSINDPPALTEYLNQVNLKGEMVLDELKRVSAEKDGFKKKMEEAKRDAKDAWDQVAKLKSRSPEPVASDGVSAGTKSDRNDRKQATEQPSDEDGDDLFSYDDEIPRIEAELKQSQEKVQRLEDEVGTLRRDLKSARDSTESMSESLEETAKELNILRDAHREAKSRSEELMSQLETADAKYRKLELEISSGRQAQAQEQIQEHAARLKSAESEVERLQKSNADSEAKAQRLEDARGTLEDAKRELEKEKTRNEVRLSTTEKLIDTLKGELNEAEEQIKELSKERDALQQSLHKADTSQNGKLVIERQANQESAERDATGAEADNDKVEAGKKNKKKKKRGAKGVTATESAAKAGSVPEAKEVKPEDETAELKVQLEKALADLKEKETAIEKLSRRLKEQDSQQEEIELLRDDLIDKGQGLLDAKEEIKRLQLEKDGLNRTIEELRSELVEVRGSHASTSAQSEKVHQDLAVQFEDLKLKSKTLETDLAVAQQLASSRFKDLSDLKEKMQKAQPEIRSLRSENEELKNVKKELDEKVASLERLQIKHDNLQAQINTLKKSAADKSKEIGSLNGQLRTELDGKQKLEIEGRKLRGDLSSAQSEAKNASQSLERVASELSQARQTVRRHEARMKELEIKLAKAETDGTQLREEIELKSAQHASAESLMNSMRDQTSEMATQLKETRERCESLDEEVADAHRLLTERTREGETMRRLLAEIETRTDGRIREMRDRMNAAVEERERVEDEASTTNRRRAREVEEARSKLREAERELREAQDARDRLDAAQREWKQRREELEQFVERNKAETEEAKTAMGRIRDALDESERQARDLEKQKADLRRSFEDSKTQVEKLEKRNKALTDEVKQLQSKPKTALSSPGSSSPAGSRVMSPTPARRESSAKTDQSISQGVYMKSVLLQFLEMKEKKHQMQFVPTLANLLQLDSADQQKLIAAITAR